MSIHIITNKLVFIDSIGRKFTIGPVPEMPEMSLKEFQWDADEIRIENNYTERYNEGYDEGYETARTEFEYVREE